MKVNKPVLWMVACVLGTMLVASVPLKAQQFLSFSDFVQSVKAADANSILALKTTKATDAASIEEMRQHLLALYDGVEVTHSYLLDSQTIDCIPLMQQPAVRMLGLRAIAEAPAATAPPGQDAQAALMPSQLPAGETQDAFGNRLGCQGDTIPMVRVTLEQMAHFKTLHDFFAKGPAGTGRLEDPSVMPDAPAHKYVVYYQSVNNHGDEADINLWRPYVYTDIGEIFSLAQSWTVGGSGSSTQTAEVGWINYPDFFSTENSVPFIYYTADGYNQTGCYNLTCGKFVQVSHALTFGAAFAAGSYSVPGGSQHYLPLQWKLASGNWNLYYNGTRIGYYPGSVYLGGQMSRYSTLLEFGSESVGSTVWPAEGSGQFGAVYSNKEAAWQKNLFYLDTSNHAVWDSLTYDPLSPACYTGSALHYSSSWGKYFYFGGPGGTGC